MLKAIFLDLDETLCDTTKANIVAKEKLADKAIEFFPSKTDAINFSNDYLKGMYKDLTPEQKAVFFPIICEETFRTKLIQSLGSPNNSVKEISYQEASDLREYYDSSRIQCFDFFDGAKEFIIKLRKEYTLVLITNGPVYSQVPKVEQVSIKNFVDHVIIGGQEPEEKPFKSIFSKALKLAGVEASEAMHVGDSVAADIVGANNSGITSVWINPDECENQHADFHIPNITHLGKVISQLS
ncbi:MAG: HAD-IA family hydrolase [Lentisphaeraceae bacterium]|nr:HAD-IA family hydrolase [Lentisphaeraceae bacterium]